MIRRTAVYGPVRTVVWEGRSREAPPYPDHGPDPERDKVSAWRLVDICAHAERTYGVRYSAWGMSRLLKRLEL